MTQNVKTKIVAQVLNSCTKVAQVFDVVQLQKIAQVALNVKTENVDIMRLNKRFLKNNLSLKIIKTTRVAQVAQNLLLALYVRTYT